MSTTIISGKTKKVSKDLPAKGNASIIIKGARTHNLKNIDVTFPHGKLIVVTGVSGSGKSSLTIDTLFAEGQRRYAESLSAYARQFMQRMNKPDVDYIKGLCPAIAIEQKVTTRTPRSTVGSMTEMYDYLRLLFARIGRTISPVSGRQVKKDDVGDVINAITASAIGDKLHLLVPFRQHEKRNTAEELNILLQKGFTRLYADKDTLRIEDLLEDATMLKKLEAGFKKKAKAYVLIDRLVVREFEEDDIHRISDSVDTAFYEGEGECFLEVNGEKLLHFSNKFELDGMQFEEPVPNLFSFNNPFGACPTCEGFGQVLGVDADMVMPDTRLSVYEGAIAPWRGEKMSEWNKILVRTAPKFQFPIHKPIHELTKEQYKLLWTGNEYFEGLNAFFKEVEQNLYKVQYRVLLSRYRGKTLCPDCDGYRLRKDALYVKIADKHIGELCELPIKDLQVWFNNLQLTESEQNIGKRLLIELHTRMQTMLDVGLGYLTLNRLAMTLSGGESQRIQLTRSLGSNLTNSLYILDEPSIGLHSRDTERLISVLKNLRDLGNTVVVVEHDEMMMREADYIIDMGPLASHKGGEVVASGNYADIMKAKDSLTSKYLSGKMQVERTPLPRIGKKHITITGARQNNLKDIDVRFPLECLTVVSGVSGSGKTTLVKQILYPALLKLKGEFADKVGKHKKIEGNVDDLSLIEMVDQNPIGKSSRSNPVTYIKAWDAVRDLYADLPLSKIRGYQPRHYSFNVDGGRCDTCKGEGEQVVEMQFLADVHLTCESCKGKRFKDEVLEVKFNEKNIYDILELSVDEAIEFFNADVKQKLAVAISKAIQPLSDVGLGYVKLGQSSDTLSGGEAQRVKLASFLGKGKSTGHVLFIFDEPTTGLHFHDIQKLLNSFNALIAQGHSIIVIEHNTDVIRHADWVIDLGPEAGDGGGQLVYDGPPEGLKDCKESWTGRFM
jgi:excinuclease ABC subunit A